MHRQSPAASAAAHQPPPAKKSKKPRVSTVEVCRLCLMNKREGGKWVNGHVHYRTAKQAGGKACPNDPASDGEVKKHLSKIKHMLNKQR